MKERIALPANGTEIARMELDFTRPRSNYLSAASSRRTYPRGPADYTAEEQALDRANDDAMDHMDEEAGDA